MHLLYNVTCNLVQKHDQHRETPDTICFDCRPYNIAGEVAYRARRELVHFSTRNLLIPNFAVRQFLSSTCKNSHKFWELNVRMIPIMTTPCVFT